MYTMKRLCEAFRYKFVPTCHKERDRKNKTLGFAQTQQGNDSPAPPLIKPPTPDSFGGSLAGRQESNVFDSMPRGFGCSEIVNSLNSFRYRFSQTFTVDNCHVFSSAASFTLAEENKRRWQMPPSFIITL